MSVYVRTDSIPIDEVLILESSTFFQRNPGVELPRPQDIRIAHQLQTGQQDLHPEAPHIVRYPEYSLCVKYSRRVKQLEAQALYIVTRYLTDFPAPEIYGWRKDGDDVFLFIELIDGQNLSDAWDSLSECEKTDVWIAIKDRVLSPLATLRQISTRECIGTLQLKIM